MEKENIATPDNVLVRMQVVHFGKILFNLQFIALAIMIAGMVTFIFVPLYYLCLALVSLITLFTIYVFYPEFASLWSVGETFTKIAETISATWIYSVPIMSALAIASIVCLCFDKHDKHIARIVISAIVLAIAVVVLIFKLVGGAGVTA